MKKNSGLLVMSFPFALLLSACTDGESEPGQQLNPNPEESTGIAPEGSGFTVLAVTEAPTGFELVSNGVATDEEFAEALEVFKEQETLEEGLGPLYNALGCGDCHDTPITGGASQVAEVRAGRLIGTTFFDHPGGSLINERAIDPSIQETVLSLQNVRTLRVSLGLFGDGFVEAIANDTLNAIRLNQPLAQRGTLIQVPVLEAPGQIRVGRFGWKNQQASLLSFSADAYLNEMGITSPLQPTENTSNGNSVADFDEVADPEDEDGADIQLFALFMRSLTAPPIDEERAATASAQRGSNFFNASGCAVCHVRSIDTAPAGTVINGGAFVVPAALGDKTIHPFSDFLLHDIGTGDGIVQNGGQATRNQVRTPPLWGLRTKTRLMHDGVTFTRTEAINLHGVQAAAARNFFNNVLDANQQQDLINFLFTL
jgi:CxxC motif-containing protein (DUF1111 family)